MITKIDIDNDEKVGRLGNKLFQIAAGYSIAKEMNDEFAIPNWKYRNDFPNVPIKDIVGINKVWSEPSFTYFKPPVEYFSEVVHLNGYFQSHKYFSSREDILKLLESGPFAKSMSKIYEENNGIKFKNYSSIHIRRGDYVNLTNYYVDLPSTSYYTDAINMLGDKKYIVFSDDIDFCIQYFSQFQGIEFHYVSGNCDVVDMYIMTQCKNNIIANSSFSWWGAYLNNNNPIVIAPKNWFVCGLDSKDLYVDNWKVI